MTPEERRIALDAIAAEVKVCQRCRLGATRTQAVPGEGEPETEVVFVGEGPGFNEDRLGRPFVGRAGDLLVKLLATLGWRRSEVFITNVVKCRPPDNRDPEPDEIAACLPYLKRQLEILEPALVVTLGRHSMGRAPPRSTRSTTLRPRSGARRSSARATPTWPGSRTRSSKRAGSVPRMASRALNPPRHQRRWRPWPPSQPASTNPPGRRPIP